MSTQQRHAYTARLTIIAMLRTLQPMTTRSEIAPLGESVGALECIFIHAAMCTYHDLMSYRAVWASFDLGVGAKLSGGNSGPPCYLRHRCLE